MRVTLVLPLPSESVGCFLEVMESLKYVLLLLLVPEVLSGNVSKEKLLDEMVKLGFTEEEKNELLKIVEE